MKQVVVLNDVQIPFQDQPVLDLVTDFICDLRPHGLVWNGDMADMYQLSTFSKDPLSPYGLKDEIQQAGELQQRQGKYVKEKVWVGGNHEHRLQRYLWDHAAALQLDPKVEFERLFRTREHGFVYLPYGETVELGSLTVTHGSLVRKWSGQSAKAHFEKYGASIMIGHTHRLGVFYKRDIRGVHGAWENGCLCRLDPEYDQHPDWQQGFSVVHVHDDGSFNVQQIPIINREFFFYGSDKIAIPAKKRKAA